MKTDVRLLSLRNLLLLEASLLQQARLILSQVTSSPGYSNGSAETTTYAPLTTNFTCAPCTVSVQETVLSFPVPVNVTTETATATVIPYITQYPDGTNVTSYSTYSDYMANANSNANFTAPASEPLTWTTLGFTLTYPTTYIAFPSPEAGINSIYIVNSTSYCYATNLTAIPNLSSASLLFPYNTINLTATPTTQTAQVFAAATTTTPLTSTAPSFLPIAQTALASLTSALLSYLDTLPQLSSIVSTNPLACSQTVVLSISEIIAATTAATNFVPIATVQHTSVAVLTETGPALVTVVTAVPDQEGSGTAGGNAATTGASNAGGSSIEYVTVGSSSFLVSAAQNGGGDIVIGDDYATLAPGSGIAINGVPVSYEVSGSTTALIVGGSAVSGHVYGGATVSLAAGGSSAVINGPSETLTSPGIGVTGSSASVSAASTLHKGDSGCLGAPVCLIALVIGVVGALTIAL